MSVLATAVVIVLAALGAGIWAAFWVAMRAAESVDWQGHEEIKN